MIQINKLNESFLKIICDDPGVKLEISEYFTFDVPNAHFMPSYKSKMWDGKIRLFDNRKNRLYIGLYTKLVEFLKNNNYEYSSNISINPNNIDITSFLDSINIGEYTVRDYQKTAIEYCINHEKLFVEMATGSGKSLVIYLLCRYFNVKTLLLVPTINLVNQMYGDFKDYSKNDSWKVIDNCHKIFSGESKESNKCIDISTWQSVYDLKEDFFEKYEMVIVDEAHQAKSNSITKILEKSINARYRFGFSGTANQLSIDRLVVNGLIGNIQNFAKTKELIDKNILSNLEIKNLILNYSESDMKEYNSRVYGLRGSKKYFAEMDFICSHEKRTKFLSSLACIQTNNTLILFNFIEKHGEIIYNNIKELVTKKDLNKNVYFVFGGTDANQREEIRKYLELGNNNIIIASYGVFSTGVNIKNLHNLILAHPSKSYTRVLQSIGRMLRLNNNKISATVYDICDNLSFSSNHYNTRLEYYIENQFNYKLINRSL